MKNNKILIFLEIINLNQFLIFLRFTHFNFFKNIKNLSKEKKCKMTLLILTSDEYKSDLDAFFNKKLNNNSVNRKFFCYDKNSKSNNSKNNIKKKILNFYKVNYFESLIKIKGDYYLTESYLIELYNAIKNGNQIIFKNILKINEEKLKEINFNNKNFENLIFNFIKKNKKYISNKNHTKIKYQKNKIKIYKKIPNLLAFSGNIEKDFTLKPNKNYKNFIFKENYFSHLTYISVKLQVGDNKNLILDNVINGVRKLYFKKTLEQDYFRDNVLILNNKNMKLNYNEKNYFFPSNFNLNYFFDYNNFNNFDYYKNILTLSLFFNYFQNNKVFLFFIMILAFLPFKIKWFFYKAYLNNKKNKFSSFILNKFIILPRKEIINYLFKN